MARMPQIKIQIHTDTLEWVKAEADRRRISVAQVIRELILKAMRKERER